jgi:pimeloyl-ACP methyl ester carboxylesterase
MWPVWNRIQCPVLVLRGAESDVLSKDVAARMRRQGPRAKVVEFKGVGHAPALMSKEQIDVVRRWLLD